MNEYDLWQERGPHKMCSVRFKVTVNQRAQDVSYAQCTIFSVGMLSYPVYVPLLYIVYVMVGKHGKITYFCIHRYLEKEESYLHLIKMFFSLLFDVQGEISPKVLKLGCKL